MGSAASAAVDAVEGATGVDINGDGTVGSGAAADGEKQGFFAGLKDKAEDLTGMDIDGDGTVGTGAASAVDAAADVAADAEAAVEEASGADI